MGEINDQPSRSWATNDDDSQMHCYLGMKGRITLHELISHFEEEYPHVDPMYVELNYATATWYESPTADDLAKREAHRTWSAERQERWERETYTRLKAKYGKGARR